MKVFFCMLLACFLSYSAFATTTIPEVVAHHTIREFSNQPDSTLPRQTLTRKAILQSGAQNVEQLLLFAGLQVTDLNGDGSNTTVNFRGFGDNAAQNSVILLNGEPVITADLGSYDFNQIPINIIDRVEIIPASAGVEYGNQAVGGVVNIITRPIEKKQLYVQGAAGNQSTYQEGAGISKALNSETNGRLNLFNIDTDNYRDRNQLNQSHLDLAGEKQFTSNDLFTEYQLNDQRLQYPGALTMAQVIQNRRQAENPHDANNEIDQSLQLIGKHDFNANFQGKVQTLFINMNGDGTLTTAYDDSRKGIDISPSISGLTTVGKWNFLPTAGIDLNNGEYQFNNNNAYKSTSTQNILSEFAEIHWPIKSAWTINAGARHATAWSDQSSVISGFSQDTHSKNAVWVSNIGLGWQLNPLIRLYLRRAGSFRFPKTDENINTNTGKPLKPQTGISYETGFVWQYHDWTGLFEIYQIHLHDEITAIPVPNSETTYAENQNLPDTTREGFSVNMTDALSKKLLLRGVYRYVDARFDSGPDNGNRIPFVANNTGSFDITYKPTTQWSITGESDYIGEMPFANDPEARTRLLGGYTLFGVSLGYQWRWATLNFNVKNLFNKMYYSYAFDMYNGSQTNSYFYPAPGRTFLLTLTVKLS